MKSFFKMQMNNDVAEIDIFDIIGWDDCEAKDFYARMKKIESAKKLDIKIHSPGGSVFDGMAILNVLKMHKAESKTVSVMGLAASMASIIAMVGAPVRMAKGSFMMIHNPLVLTAGDSEQLRKDADFLDKIKSEAVDIYHAKTGDKSTPESIKAMMDAETWMTAEEAVEKGFADEIFEAPAIAAFASPAPEFMAKAPEGVKKLFAAKPTEPEKITMTADEYKAKLEAAAAEVEAKNKKIIDAKDAELKAAASKISTLNEELNKKQSKLDKALASVVELEAKVGRLTGGAADNFSPSDSPDVDWAKALSLSGGDYVKARKLYPEAFARFMAKKKKE